MISTDKARVKLLGAVRLNPVEISLRTEEKFEVHSKKISSPIFLFLNSDWFIFVEYDVIYGVMTLMS